MRISLVLACRFAASPLLRADAPTRPNVRERSNLSLAVAAHY